MPNRLKLRITQKYFEEVLFKRYYDEFQKIYKE